MKLLSRGEGNQSTVSYLIIAYIKRERPLFLAIDIFTITLMQECDDLVF